MDCRVKPGNDEFTASGTRMAFLDLTCRRIAAMNSLDRRRQGFAVDGAL
jgi:hypothetical protein